MGDTRFDALARSRSATHSRRGLTWLLGGAVLEGALALRGLSETAARKKRKKKKKPKLKRWKPWTAFGSQGTGPDNFSRPRGVFLAADGKTAWVADENNERVSVWRRSSATATDWANWTTFGGQGNGAYQFLWPTGLFVSSDGLTCYVADNNNHRVSVWRRTSGASTDWAFQTSFGTEGSGIGELIYPWDVAVSGDGLTAWVTDGGNDRLSIWKRPRAGSTAWTNTGTFGSEGSAANQFKRPWGVAVAGKTLLVGDFGNHRISVWTLA